MNETSTYRTTVAASRW